MCVWFVMLAVLGVRWIVLEPHVLTSVNPVLRRPVPLEQRLPGLRRAGLGVPRRHRRRGAVCRHGPFRRGADSPGVVRDGLSRADAELLRAGRAAAAAPGGRRAGVLPHGAALAGRAAGHSGDGRGLHRQPGADLGGVLDDASGGAAGVQPARRDPAHLRDHHRPDLHSDGELGADDRHHRAGAAVPVVHGAGRGLWHRHHRDDDHHDRAGVCGRAARVGLEPVDRRHAHRRVDDHRRRVPRVQRPEAPARRLGAAGHGGVRLPADVDVEDAAGRFWARGCARRRIRSASFSRNCLAPIPTACLARPSS